MISTDTLLLTLADVKRLLPLEACIREVEEAFRLYATGKIPSPGVLGLHVPGGVFHIKTCVQNSDEPFFVAKTNANFPGNPGRTGLPAIQGILSLSNAENGRLLALMDAIEITILRTGAATAVAAKYLARPDARIASIIGCGNQGRVSLRALMKVRPLEKVFVFDIDETRAKKFAAGLSRELQVTVLTVKDIGEAVRQSRICITCTPSNQPFLGPEHVMPGIFIAAVGADNERKQEIEPALLANSKVVVDILDQCAVMGELHHALEIGYMKKSDVHAELGQVIAGQKTGRTSEDEIIIFDSTGTALQDVAAAAFVYNRAVEADAGLKLDFSK